MKFSTKFVCEDRCFSTYKKNVPAPLFRKSFHLKKNAEMGEILIAGIGFYDLFINGQKITKGHIAPYINNTDHIIYYDKYDIAPYLKQGENVIGVMLGDGHLVGKTVVWDFKDNVTNAAPMLALMAEITSDGEKISFEADEFVCKKGPILFNDIRSGVFYDARLEDNWLEAGYDDSNWSQPLAAQRPRGKARICAAEPIRVQREIAPISITEGEMSPYICLEQFKNKPDALEAFEGPAPLTGGYIYDFGENNAGIYRLKIKGERGQKINIQCAEQLVEGKLNYNNINFYPAGFAQRDIYYLKGEGEEVFEPMFTYHGYRYIYVEGITKEQATTDLLTYLVMSSDLEERGSFECSDNMANTIYQMGRRSDISNFFYFPTDCPHREKNGWTGDASMSAEHMIMTIGAENSWREWLWNIRSAQTLEGQLPGIVPTDSWGYKWGSGPAWDSVLFNLPYFAYKYRGETDIIEENAAAMLRYLEYASRKRDEKGIVAYGLGDWVPVDKFCEDYDAPLGFTDSVMVYDMCRKASVMFDVVKLPLHKAFAEKLGKEMYDAIRQEYIDFDTYIVDGNCQTSQAMAIFFDIFTEEEKEQAFKVLMDIVKNDNFSITSGFLGLRVIFHVLSEFGEENLAYEMITRDKYPSYGYWVNKGETTFLEAFFQYDNYYSSSKNHHFLGDVVNWFMRHPGGLNVQNDSTLIVSPKFIDKLDWCKTSHKLPDGEIEIYWERKHGGIELRIRCSGTVHYTIRLDNKYNCENMGDDTYFINE